MSTLSALTPTGYVQKTHGWPACSVSSFGEVITKKQRKKQKQSWNRWVRSFLCPLPLLLLQPHTQKSPFSANGIGISPNYRSAELLVPTAPGGRMLAAHDETKGSEQHVRRRILMGSTIFARWHAFFIYLYIYFSFLSAPLPIIYSKYSSSTPQLFRHNHLRAIACLVPWYRTNEHAARPTPIPSKLCSKFGCSGKG